jgi:aspartate racemase
MARVGIVGGLGPESTIDYYRRTIAVWQEIAPGSAPEIVIDSLDVDLGIRLVGHDRPALAEYLLASVYRLERAGADFVVMAANTPHVVFDSVAARAPVPMLSIVATCASEASRRGFRRLGLLGTRFTMEASLYPDVFAMHALEIAVPVEADRAWLHERYIGELLRGDFRNGTRDGVLALVRRMKEREQLDALILGGTELPLLLRDDTVEGLPILDTTELHVRAIVDRLRTLDGTDDGTEA